MFYQLHDFNIIVVMGLAFIASITREIQPYVFVDVFIDFAETFLLARMFELDKVGLHSYITSTTMTLTSKNTPYNPIWKHDKEIISYLQRIKKCKARSYAKFFWQISFCVLINLHKD